MAFLSLNKISKLFNPISSNYKTPVGNAGFDNARENIDPRIVTKALLTKEIVFNGVPQTPQRLYTYFV